LDLLLVILGFSLVDWRIGCKQGGNGFEQFVDQFLGLLLGLSLVILIG
jgi:hypothetical protein